MRKNLNAILLSVILFFDAFSIIAAFYFAYFIRTSIDVRPYFFEEKPVDFLSTLIFLLPFWLLILFFLGLYKKPVLWGKNRLSETLCLTFASLLGTMSIITIAYFKTENIFPVRPVAIYTTIACFFLLILFRNLSRFIFMKVLKSGKNQTSRALIVGETKNTYRLSSFIKKSPESGYSLCGIVGKTFKQNVKSDVPTFSSLKSALEKITPDVIFQTDNMRSEYVYKTALDLNIPYYFIPSESELFTKFGDLELIGGIPAIHVRVTTLTGIGRFVKRVFDIILGLIFIIIAAVPMMVIWLMIKLSDPKEKAIYSQIRLTRYNREFKIYKFRSMKPEYSGLSPEEAFNKMDRSDLIKKYRESGDYLENDPRITKIGAFLRRTSLDELPQIVNVLKGDISIVGPRALVPGELRNYGDRSIILSVKSGLTGLAQVSGRRNISFEERRSLDIYYVQNWSLLLDFRVLLKTIATVIHGEGAK